MTVLLLLTTVCWMMVFCCTRVRGGSGAQRTQEPLWFRKMDRNADGDVSPKEWLGTEEDFQKIDTDGDGLISAEEAERYDELLKKQKR